MTRDPVLLAEEEHDSEMQAAQDRYDANRVEREIAIEEIYSALVNDPIWLWEALGPDGFQPPRSGNGAFTQQQNYAAEAVFRQSISDAVLTRDDLQLGQILGGQARAYIRRAAERRHEQH